MKKLIWILLFAAVPFVCSAQNYLVYSRTGQVEYFADGEWKKLNRRDALKSTDEIRIGEKSAISIIDKKTENIYSYGQPGTVKVKSITSKSSSAVGRYARQTLSTLVSGQTDKISYEANVIYRDLSADLLLYTAFIDTSFQSAYKVQFQLIDEKPSQELESPTLGTSFYFSIINNDQRPLFVNILAIDADGGVYDCLPIDEGLTMSHALIPAGSTVDLSGYPLITSDPVGRQDFILLAFDRPFDLRQIIRHLKENSPTTEIGKVKIGKVNHSIIIK